MNEWLWSFYFQYATVHVGGTAGKLVGLHKGILLADFKNREEF